MPWTVALQVPLSMGFSRQEPWSGWPCPPPGDLPDPGVEPRSPALQADSLLLSHLGSAGDALTMSKRTTDLQTLWTEHIKPRSSRLSPRLRFSLRLPPSLSLALTSPLFKLKILKAFNIFKECRYEVLYLTHATSSRKKKRRTLGTVVSYLLFYYISKSQVFPFVNPASWLFSKKHPALLLAPLQRFNRHSSHNVLHYHDIIIFKMHCFVLPPALCSVINN